MRAHRVHEIHHSPMVSCVCLLKGHPRVRVGYFSIYSSRRSRARSEIIHLTCFPIPLRIRIPYRRSLLRSDKLKIFDADVPLWILLSFFSLYLTIFAKLNSSKLPGLSEPNELTTFRCARERFLNGSVSPYVIVVPEVNYLPTPMKRAENSVNTLLLDAGLLSQLFQGHWSCR